MLIKQASLQCQVSYLKHLWHVYIYYLLLIILYDVHLSNYANDLQL